MNRLNVNFKLVFLLALFISCILNSKAQGNIHFFQPSLNTSFKGFQTIGDSIIRAFGISYDRINPYEGGAFFTDLHTSDPQIYPDLSWISDSLAEYTFAVKDFYTILLDSGFAILVFEHIDCDFSGTPVICLLNPTGTLEWIRPLENVEAAKDIQKVYRVDKDLIKIVTEFQSIYFDLEGNFMPVTNVHLTYDSLIVYSNGYLGILDNQYIVLDRQFNTLKNLGEIPGFRFFDIVLRDHYLLARPDSFFLLDENFKIIHKIKGWAPFGSVVSINNRILTISSAFFQITIFDSMLQILDSYFYAPTYTVYGGKNVDGQLYFLGTNRGIYQRGVFLSFVDTADTNLIPEHEDAEFTSLKLPVSITYDTSEFALDKDGFDMYLDTLLVGITNLGDDTLHSIFINFLADVPCNRCTRKYERWNIDSLNVPPGEYKLIDLGNLVLNCAKINIGELCFWISSPDHHTDGYPQNDDLCQSIQMFTDIEEFKPYKGIHIYPNPASSSIRIVEQTNYSAPETYAIRIHGFDGRLMMQENFIAEQTEFDVSYLPAGIYTVSLTDDTGVIAMKKLAIVR